MEFKDYKKFFEISYSSSFKQHTNLAQSNFSSWKNNQHDEQQNQINQMNKIQEFLNQDTDSLSQSKQIEIIYKNKGVPLKKRIIFQKDNQPNYSLLEQNAYQYPIQLPPINIFAQQPKYQNSLQMPKRKFHLPNKILDTNFMMIKRSKENSLKDQQDSTKQRIEVRLSHLDVESKKLKMHLSQRFDGKLSHQVGIKLLDTQKYPPMPIIEQQDRQQLKKKVLTKSQSRQVLNAPIINFTDSIENSMINRENENDIILGLRLNKALLKIIKPKARCLQSVFDNYPIQLIQRRGINKQSTDKNIQKLFLKFPLNSLSPQSEEFNFN